MYRTSRLVLFALLVAGCSSETKERPRSNPKDSGASVALPECADAAPPGTTGDSFPCDVERILVAKCQRCHTTEDVQAVCLPKHECEAAPFPLLTWEDTRRDLGGWRPVDAIYEAVHTGYMPFQSNRVSPPVEALTPTEKKTLEDWALACAPPGNGACGDAAP
ncbi:MAG TPA: hypothetical protein VHE30_03695 [Polyangiaceae bacterium]|nr:hypothetical protein [Polyangiaceae bacterium]